MGSGFPERETLEGKMEGRLEGDLSGKMEEEEEEEVEEASEVEARSERKEWVETEAMVARKIGMIMGMERGKTMAGRSVMGKDSDMECHQLLQIRMGTHRLFAWRINIHVSHFPLSNYVYISLSIEDFKIGQIISLTHMKLNLDQPPKIFPNLHMLDVRMSCICCMMLWTTKYFLILLVGFEDNVSET